MRLRFLFHYPEQPGAEADALAAGSLTEVAVAVERAGFDGFSLSEHPVPGARWLSNGGHQTLDPFVALGHVAAVTRRLRLLTYLAVAPYRNPFLLAKAAATVDLLSGGRLVLGLGAGYQKSEFHALGVDFAERNALFDEVLDVLALHWSGAPFSYQGRHFSARDVLALPRPAQFEIPIWIGGNAPRSLRRVARRAQGWLPMSGNAQLSRTARTPQLGDAVQLADRIATVQEMASAMGRTERLDVVHSYGEIGVDPVDTHRHLERLDELEKAGVTWVLVSSRTAERAATLAWIEAFGAAYLADRD